jgi:integrase/recombinase XerD
MRREGETRKGKMTEKSRLYLPYAEWPKTDKALWKQTFEPSMDPFEDGGRGAHLSERTVQQLQYAYGKFLYFISVRHHASLKRVPARRLNAKIVAEFVRWQPETCGSVTLSVYLFHLWLALRHLCPRDDWQWLSAISTRIKAQAKPKPEKHHLVTSEVLHKLGFRLMDSALRKSPTTWRGRIIFRDGLIIALLASIPLRRRTLSALRIGKQLIKSGERWFLDIPAEDVKSKRPLDYPISADLSRRIDVYVDQIRPHTAGANTHDYLWASSRGRPMNGHALYSAVGRRVDKALGFPIGLQRFRHAAATFWSLRDPANVRGTKDLLGHASFEPTEKHYILAQSRVAGRALARVIDNLI